MSETGTVRLLGWQLSYYTAKVRSYLIKRDISFTEKAPDLWLFRKIRKEVGAQVIPVVILPDGTWLQDSSHIIDVLEERRPTGRITPTALLPRFAGLLLEAWADEFWVPPAMHYRWSFADNIEPYFLPEAGRLLLPWAPKFLRRMAAQKIAGGLQAYLPGIGVRPEQIPLIERWTCQHLDLLDAHFRTHDFLLGTAPCHGDFALFGPLSAHLARDPWPALELMSARPALLSWIMRMQSPPGSRESAPLGPIPLGLNPLFRSLFSEFFGYARELVEQVQEVLPNIPRGQPLPRGLGEVEFPFLDGVYRRRAAPYTLWMVQRALDAYRNGDADGQAAVREWLDGLDAGAVLDFRIGSRLRRSGLRVIAEPEA